MSLFVGLMSGTSMDGIDAALVDVSTHALIAGITCPYSDKAKQCLVAALKESMPGPAVISQLNTLLGREFADATNKLLKMTNVSLKDVVAIGSHGQTICHDATADIPYTVQLGCAHTIAELTGITVVADFRTRDLVIGGQGAPFAPLYHQAMFGGSDLPLAIVNIGGIANVTFLSQTAPVSGYDIGPGNCLMDNWILKHQGLAFDADGQWAMSGKVIEPLLKKLLADPYFESLPPKSLGKEYFSSKAFTNLLQGDYGAEDVQATLLALSATTIANDIKKSMLPLKQVMICGGGVHNTALIEAIQFQLPKIKIESTKTLGIDPDFLEAMMFAWLAERAINKIPVDFKSITGAKHLAIFGAIYAGGIDW